MYIGNSQKDKILKRIVIAILMGNNGVFFKHLQQLQPVELLMNVMNAIPGKARAGPTINKSHSITARTKSDVLLKF